MELTDWSAVTTIIFPALTTTGGATGAGAGAGIAADELDPPASPEFPAAVLESAVLDELPQPNSASTLMMTRYRLKAFCLIVDSPVWFGRRNYLIRTDLDRH
ncbi:MAG TPA: hypothetical protein VNI36_00620 [Candidatus Dormibacteraeota bacterium]|nr:hypothetical protein [Candidatus Dormibacteraeota bacterium]